MNMREYDETELPEEPLYATNFKMKLERQTPRSAFNTFVFCIIAAGPLAVVTVLAYQFHMFGDGSGVRFFKAVFLAPPVEEFAKIATPLIILSRYPWRWLSGSQLVFACVFSGLVFAAIENLLYLFVYVENPSARMVVWRWTVCVSVHAVCSALAGCGLLRVWRNTHKTFARPDALPAAPWFVAAVVIHGVYNAAATWI